MRRALMAMMVVGVLVVATGLADPRVVQAAPGYFNFSIGTPGYNFGYSGGYPGVAPYGYAAPYAYPAPVAPQPYFYGGVPYGAPRYGYPAPYGAYYGGYYGRPGYGHYGHGHHHW
ncbi:MAG TPA: hypothetical protein VGN12_28995 [Pirellulales bacterium]|jgi:hypothetical protein